MSRRFFALFLTLTLSLLINFHPQSVYAAQSEESYTVYFSEYSSISTNPRPEWMFHPDRSGSLTIRSFIAQTGEEKEGTYLDGQNIPADSSPLQGAVYSFWKIGDLRQLVIDDTVGLFVCHMSADFLQYVRSTFDTSSCVLYKDGEAYYPVASLQDALDAAVADGEDALVRLVSDKGTAMIPTDEEGRTRADGLSVGLYILAMTKTPESTDVQVLSGQTPSLILLPQMNPASYSPEDEILDPENLWLYDIFIYPKNRKLMSGKKILLPDSSCTADDRETGGTVSYAAYVNLPVLGDDRKYEYISVTDKMTPGLSQAEIQHVVYGPWLTKESLSAQAFDSFNELFKDVDYTDTIGPHGFSLELTGQGLDKVNQFSVNAGLYIIYDVLLDKNAYIGTSGTNVNESAWSIGIDSSTVNYTLPSSRTYLTTYGIHLIKTGLRDASAASFEISRGNRLLFFEQTDIGSYTVSGTENEEHLTSSLHPAPDGQLFILGLGSESYTFKETTTEHGHNLLPLPFTITLTGNPQVCGTLEKAELTMGSTGPIPISLSGSNAGIAEFSITNEGMITPLKAGDDSYIFIAAYTIVFGLLLLVVLLIKKRSMDKPGSDTEPKGGAV